MKWLRSRTAVVAVVAAVAALTICLGTWQGWLVEAAPDEVYVNDNLLPDVEGCNDPATVESTIADGILAADANDTVIICEGEYDGPVTVDKTVTIEGRAEANRVDIVVKGASDGFAVTADNVTIRHMLFDGVDDTGIGIHVTGNGATIEDVDAVHWHTGIALEGSSGSVIQDSLVDYNSAQGIVAEDGADNVIRRNVAGPDNNVGVVLENEDVTLVAENDLAGTGAALWLDADAPDVLNVRVVSNTIHAGSDGIHIEEIPSADSLIVIGGRLEDGNTFEGTPDGITDYFVELDCGIGPPETEVTVNATWNYWAGLTDASAIAAVIYDDEDQNECADDHGAVVFHPWASEIPPTPSPSPTPEPSPSPTVPPTTRTFDLEMGWNNFVWTGATGTDPATVLSCIDGFYVIAYRFVASNQSFERYVPDDALLSNMTNLNKYDSLLVLVTASGVQCADMPVDAAP
jgi:parallel beta-helix repeat protein